MLITNSPKTTPVVNRTQANAAAAKEQATLVERIVDKTYLGANYLSSSIGGAATGVGAFGTSVLQTTAKTTVDVYKNLWKTETLGPNIKILGSLVAGPAVLAGAALSLPVSLVAGACYGAGKVDSSQPRHFTVPAAAENGYGKVKSAWNEFGTEATKSLNEWGNEKLAAGEKPFDIPIIKTLKSVGVGAAAVAIGGIAGVMSAVVSTGREAAVGVADAFMDENLSIPGKVLGAAGALISAPIQGVIYGAATTVTTIGEGVSQTWKKDALGGGLSRAFSEAKNSVLAAAAPEHTLLQEKPTE